MSDTHAGRFPETSWGTVARAAEMDETTRHTALADLCEIYWPPLYTFARHRGHSPQDAEDLTQGFVAHLVEQNTLSRVDSQRGKLRTFLLGAFKLYMARVHQQETRLKRGGGQLVISLNRDLGERHFMAIPSGDLTPDAMFDRQWLFLLFDRTLQKLQSEYERKKKARQFEVLKHFLDDRENQSYEAASRALGMNSGAVRVAVHRITQTYRDLLRTEVSQTLPDGADAEVELQALAANVAV